MLKGGANCDLPGSAGSGEALNRYWAERIRRTVWRPQKQKRKRNRCNGICPCVRGRERPHLPRRSRWLGTELVLPIFGFLSQTTGVRCHSLFVIRTVFLRRLRLGGMLLPEFECKNIECFLLYLGRRSRSTRMKENLASSSVLGVSKDFHCCRSFMYRTLRSDF